MGIPHSSSSVISEIYRRLGWNNDAGGRRWQQYGENKGVWTVKRNFKKLKLHIKMMEVMNSENNSHLVDEIRSTTEGKELIGEMRQAISNQKCPWVLKDVAWFQILPYFKDLFSEEWPALMWTLKDLDLVEESYKRRNENKNKSMEDLKKTDYYCKWNFDKWDGGRYRVDINDIRLAVSNGDVDAFLKALNVFEMLNGSSVEPLTVDNCGISKSKIQQAMDAFDAERDGKNSAHKGKQGYRF